MKRLRNQKGLTMVELLCVIVIVAILSGIVVKKVFLDTTADEVTSTFEQKANERKNIIYDFAKIEERSEEDAKNDK